MNYISQRENREIDPPGNPLSPLPDLFYSLLYQTTLKIASPALCYLLLFQEDIFLTNEASFRVPLETGKLGRDHLLRRSR
jgi:hypothetical protein